MLRALTFASLVILIMLLPASVYAGIFFDDFEKENDLWIVGMGEWKIENGVYHQTDLGNNSAKGVFTYAEGSENWGDDFTIEVKVINHQATSHYEAGIMYKWQDLNTQFHVVLDQDQSLVRINNCVGGTWQTNQNISMPFDLNEWYDLKVVVENNSHTIFVDGNEIQQYDRDVTGTTGFIGLKTLGCEVSFDDYKVTGPNVPEILGQFVNYKGKLAAAWGQIKDQSGI